MIHSCTRQCHHYIIDFDRGAGEGSSIEFLLFFTLVLAVADLLTLENSSFQSNTVHFHLFCGPEYYYAL